MTEAELWLREPLGVDTFDYPVSSTSGSLLPTFAPTPAAGSEEALDMILAAQNEADRTAGERDKELPLSDSADHHRLLFNLASKRQYDEVFGEEGRLEIWIRRSDLMGKDFEHAVSSLHNT